MNLIFIISSQEAIELSLDELYDFLFGEPLGDWSLDIIVIDNVLKKIMILVQIHSIIIHITFPHLTHSSPSHGIHLVFVHILIIISIKQSSRSSSASISNLLILIQLLINNHPLVHGEFFLLFIVQTSIFVVIQFILLPVILLHVLHEVFTLNLILRVVEAIIIVNILLDVLLSDIAFVKKILFTSFIVSSMILSIQVIIVPTKNKLIQVK